MGSRERLIALLDKALEEHGAAVAQTANVAAPVHLLYETAEMLGVAQEHLDDETGDEEPVAPELLAHAALIALMTAVVVEETHKARMALRRAG